MHCRILKSHLQQCLGALKQVLLIFEWFTFLLMCQHDCKLDVIVRTSVKKGWNKGLLGNGF